MPQILFWIYIDKVVVKSKHALNTKPYEKTSFKKFIDANSELTCMMKGN